MKTLLTILLIAVSCFAYGQKQKFPNIDTTKWRNDSMGYLYIKDSSYKRSYFTIVSDHEWFAQIKANSDTFEINPNAKYYYGVRVRYIKVGNTIIKLND